jgi:hypothetical protein
MDTTLSHEENRVLDELIARRRSMRAFKADQVPEVYIPS